MAEFSSALDFKTEVPTRIKRIAGDTASYVLVFSAATVILGALIADVVLVFSKLQSFDGEFIIHGLASVNWLAVLIVSACAAAISAILFFVAKRRASSVSA